MLELQATPARNALDAVLGRIVSVVGTVRDVARQCVIPLLSLTTHVLTYSLTHSLTNKPGCAPPRGARAAPPPRRAAQRRPRCRQCQCQSPAAAPNPPLRSSVCQGGRGAGAPVRVGPPRLEPHASPPHVPRRARAVPRQRFGTLPSRPGRCRRGRTDETSRAAPRPWQPDPPGLEG